MNYTERLDNYFQSAPLSDAADAEDVQILALAEDFWQQLYQVPSDPVDDRPESDVNSEDYRGCGLIEGDDAKP